MRRKRLEIPGIPMHLVHRGVNRGVVFNTDRDRHQYLVGIELAAVRFGVCVHGYVLMSNHVHLLVSAGAAGCVSLMMQSAASRYVRHFNQRYGRTGTLWEGRFWSGLVDSDRSLLACLAYIELNPVRAGMAPAVEGWRWSSVHHHLGQRHQPLVRSHETFVALGVDTAARAIRWKELLASVARRGVTRRLRRSIYEGFAFGSRQFRDRVSSTSGVGWKPAPVGRPPNKMRPVPQVDC